MTRRLVLVLGVSALVLGIAGCGSHDSTDDTADSTMSSSVVPQTTTVASTPSYAGPTDPPGVTAPFIDHVQWVQTPQGSSLQVVPTHSGRVAQAPADMDEAWGEVVKDDPKADTPGMQAQFNCHWQFARIIEPNKPSWNLEPWRPVVSPDQMIMTQCNPGGPEI